MNRLSNSLSDFWRFLPDTSKLERITSDYSAVAGPQPAFTPRANLDIKRNQIVVLSGLTRQSGSSKDSIVKSELWAYDLKKGEWKKVQDKDRKVWGHNEDEDEEEEGRKHQCVFVVLSRVRLGSVLKGLGYSVGYDRLPPPRYAHQFVYNSKSETYYLYGGNSGSDPDSRLDDFWQLTITRFVFSLRL